MSAPISIALEEANEGMALAAQVCDANGNLLLPAGAVLSAAMLAALARRGVGAVVVVGPPLDEAGMAAREAERERQCARLARLFRASADQGASAQLLECLLAYRRNGTPQI